MLVRVDIDHRGAVSADVHGKQAGETIQRKALYVGAHARRVALA